MKYMFISDIHGNVNDLEECINVFKKEKADRLIILGDTVSSTNMEDTQKIAQILNFMKDKIEVIRGNCDNYDFEEKLEVELFDIDTLYINGKFVTVAHGHHANAYELPRDCGSIFIQGHTHVPMLNKIGDKIVGNPGSISRPKGTDMRCYILMEEDKISLKTIDGKLVKGILFM